MRKTRLVVLMLSGLILAGCSDDAINACEASIKQSLASPSSFKTIRSSKIYYPDQKAAKAVSISIEYDAQNAFGVSIRSTQSCSYSVKDGKVEVY